jgi:hypothetical protein
MRYVHGKIDSYKDHFQLGIVHGAGRDVARATATVAPVGLHWEVKEANV